MHARLAAVVIVLSSAGFTQPAQAQAIEGLAASAPSSTHTRELMLFGQFVGDWDFDVVYYASDGSRRTATGEWHFGWVLDGHAIQDVWMVPSRAERERTGGDPTGYGTTVRFYDPELGAWRVTWIGVLSGTVTEFVARQQGTEIVMDAQRADEPFRWIFSDITPDSFHWRAVTSTDGGKTWRTDQEMFVRRRAAGRR